MPIESMINSNKCTDVIDRKVTPDMSRVFPNGGGIFRQDLARCLSSKK